MKMRTIKFRGITIDTRKWVEGDLMHGVGPKHGQMFIHPIQSVITDKECHHLDGYNVLPESVGVFTGLLDKDGRGIWEGDKFDIERMSILHCVVGYSEGGTFTYEWVGGCFVLIIDSERTFPFDENALQFGKVTGTIHDHLLNPTK